jgi:hypothetical protein
VVDEMLTLLLFDPQRPEVAEVTARCGLVGPYSEPHRTMKLLEIPIFGAQLGNLVFQPLESDLYFPYADLLLPIFLVAFEDHASVLASGKDP